MANQRTAVWALLALLLTSGCGPDEATEFPEHAPRRNPETRHIASDAAVAAFLRQQAAHPSIDCGVGRDAESDARVYDCGSRAIAEHQSFFVQYVDVPDWTRTDDFRGLDIVAPLPPPPFVSAGYLYDAHSSSLWAVTATSGHERVTKRLLTIGSGTAPMGFGRGMRPPKLSHSVSHPSPSTEITGMVLIECVIDSAGRPSRLRVVKPLPHGLDRVAVALVNDVRFEPARLFGLPVPVVWTVTVHAEDGSLLVAATR